MKLLELISEVDQSASNEVYGDLNLESLNSECNLIKCFASIEKCNIKQYWLKKYIDVDMEVGISVYVLNGVPVAIATSHHRKTYRPQIEWVSYELFEKTRQYLIELNSTEKIPINLIKDEEMNESYTVPHHNNLPLNQMIEHSTLGLVKTLTTTSCLTDEIMVEDRNNNKVTVSLSELKLKYNIGETK